MSSLDKQLDRVAQAALLYAEEPNRSDENGHLERQDEMAPLLPTNPTLRRGHVTILGIILLIILAAIVTGILVATGNGDMVVAWLVAFACWLHDQIIGGVPAVCRY